VTLVPKRDISAPEAAACGHVGGTACFYLSSQARQSIDDGYGPSVDAMTQPNDEALAADLTPIVVPVIPTSLRGFWGAMIFN